METLDPNKRIIDLTITDLTALIRELTGNPQTIVNDFTKSEKRLVYGMTGIAQLFNCSMTTANRIKKSGVIDKAISQCGRMITVDADLALKLLNKE